MQSTLKNYRSFRILSSDTPSPPFFFLPHSVLLILRFESTAGIHREEFGDITPPPPPHSAPQPPYANLCQTSLLYSQQNPPQLFAS